MAENIQAALAEFKNNPLKEPLKLALKNLEELAKDGLTPAEVAGFIAGAKDALSKAPENVLTPAQKAAATKLLDEFSNNAAQLTKVDGASAATAINGFVEMLDADTEEKAKEAAKRSQAAAPDFFQMIIGAILTMLGFTEEQVAAFTGQTAAAPTATQGTGVPSATPSMPSSSTTLIDDVGRAVGPLPNTPDARAYVQTAEYVARFANDRPDLLAPNPKITMPQIAAKTDEKRTEASQSREDYYASAFKKDAYAMANGSYSPSGSGLAGGLGVAGVGAGVVYATGATALITAGSLTSATGIGAVVGVPLIIAGATIAGAAALTSADKKVDGVPMINYDGIEGDLRRAKEEEARRKRNIKADPQNEYMGLNVTITSASINNVEFVSPQVTLTSNSPMERDARDIGKKEAENQLLASMRSGFTPRYDEAALLAQKGALGLDTQKKALADITAQKEAILLEIGRNKALSALNDDIATNPTKARSTAGAWKDNTVGWFSTTDANPKYIAEEATKNKIAAEEAIADARVKLAELEAKQSEAAKALAHGYKEEAKIDQQIEYSRGFKNKTGLPGEIEKIHDGIFAKEKQAEKDRKDAADKAKAEAEKAKAVAAEKAEKAKEEAEFQKALGGGESVSNAPSNSAPSYNGGTSGGQAPSNNTSTQPENVGSGHPEVTEVLDRKTKKPRIDGGEKLYKLPNTFYLRESEWTKLQYLASDKGVPLDRLIHDVAFLDAFKNECIFEAKTKSTESTLRLGRYHQMTRFSNDKPEDEPIIVAPVDDPHVAGYINTARRDLRIKAAERDRELRAANQESAAARTDAMVERLEGRKEREEGNKHIYGEIVEKSIKGLKREQLQNEFSQLNSNLDSIASTANSLQDLMRNIESAAKNHDIDKSTELAGKIGQLIKEAHDKGLAGFEKELQDLGIALKGAAFNEEKKGKNKLTETEVRDLKSKVEAAKQAFVEDGFDLAEKLKDLNAQLTPKGNPRPRSTPNKSGTSDGLEFC